MSAQQQKMRDLEIAPLLRCYRCSLRAKAARQRCAVFCKLEITAQGIDSIMQTLFMQLRNRLQLEASYPPFVSTALLSRIWVDE